MTAPTKARGRTVILIVAAFAAAASLAACGGGGSTAANTSSLAAALSQVQDTPTTRTEIEFGRPAAALTANRHKLAGGHYGEAVGYGLGELAPMMVQAKGTLGFDPARASYAITAGRPPRAGTLISGLHLAATPARLRALGAKRSGSTFRFAPDNQVMMHGRLAQALPTLVVGFNVVRVDGSDLRFGSSSASIGQTQASGSGLMGYPPMAAVASCLNNPLAAEITNKLPDIRKLLLGRQPPRHLTGRLAALRPTAGLQMVGVGVSGTAGAPPTEQMCVSEDSVKHADQAAAAVRTALHDGMSLTTNERWHRLLSAPSVRVQDSTVSLTAHPARRPGGVLLHALLQGDLPGIYG